MQIQGSSKNSNIQWNVIYFQGRYDIEVFKLEHCEEGEVSSKQIMFESSRISKRGKDKYVYSTKMIMTSPISDEHTVSVTIRNSILLFGMHLLKKSYTPDWHAIFVSGRRSIFKPKPKSKPVVRLSPQPRLKSSLKCSRLATSYNK